MESNNYDAAALRELEFRRAVQDYLASGGNFDVSDSDEDSDIISVHGVVDVDLQVNPNFDDVSVFYISSSEEEQSDDENMTFSEFRQSKSFMAGRKKADEKPEVQEEYATRSHSSIEQEAQEFKNDHNLNDDECIRLVEEIAKKVCGTAKARAEAKAKKILRDLQTTTREQLKRASDEALDKREEFPIHVSQEPCHIINGNDLGDSSPTVSTSRPAVIMTSENVGHAVKDVDELADICCRREKSRGIPSYIMEQRIKDAEEVVRLLRLQLAQVPLYVRTYIAILTKLSAGTINEILKHQEKNRNDSEFMETTLSAMFCSRCSIYGCTIHGSLDVKNYSYHTAAEVAMRKEESGFWRVGKQVSQSTPLICLPIDKAINTPTLSHSDKVHAKGLYFIYQGDLDKVSKALGASKQRIQKTIEAEPNQFCTKYHDVEEVEQKMLQRFHGKQLGQEYFYPYLKESKEGEVVEDKKEPRCVPCIHAGPCSKETCMCMQTGNACTRHCIWGPLSPNFFAGCECESKCMTTNCHCYANDRECDPDLCKRCQTCTDPAGLPAIPEEKGGQKCRNDYIRMRREFGDLYIAKSTIPDAGLGLFCKREIKKGTFIGEYVGELLSPEEEEKALEAGYSDEYFWELPNGYIIDAMRKGNLTRYINHKGKKESNAKAKYIKVNGDFRVALIAKSKIPAETEIFFDYGAKYWSNRKDAQE